MVEGYTGNTLHTFIIIINFYVFMAMLQHMTDKHLEKQTGFYNLHEEIIWVFRGCGQRNSNHFSKMLM